MTMTMTKAQLKALDELLDYTFHDELKDYDGCPSHVYRSIFMLAKWRGWDVPSPETLDKEMAVAMAGDSDHTA
jgi:hypothetical protein